MSYQLPQQQPPHQYGYPQQPHPAQPPKRRRWGVIATVVAVVLGAGIAGGVWVLQGDSGSSAGQENLPKNPNLETMPVPDPGKLGYDEGVTKMCDSVEKVMSQRGYKRATEGDTEGGIYCRSVTPALSLLEDGSYSLLADIVIWRDHAEDRYQRLLDKATRQRDAQAKNPEYRLSKIEQFPAGDAGYIYHREADTRGMNRGDTEAVFRSGDDTIMVSVWGSIQHTGGKLGEPAPSEPLTEEITYREITDILRALTGEGQPGEPQITEPNLQENPTLAALADLELPAGGEVCEKVATVAGQLAVKRKSGSGCVFEPDADEDDPNYFQEGYVQREMTIGVKALAETANVTAADQMGMDLKDLTQRASREDGADLQLGTLYELPVGDGGYAIHYAVKDGFGHIQSGYVIDGTIYTLIDIKGFKVAGGENTALTEDVLVADLVTVLTAMAG